MNLSAAIRGSPSRSSSASASDDTQIVVDGITFDKSAFDMLQSLVPEEQLVEVHMQMDHDYARNVQLTAKNIVVDQPKVNTNLPRVHQSLPKILLLTNQKSMLTYQ